MSEQTAHTPSQLLPCPFCGASPELTTSDEHGCAVRCYCEVGPSIRGRADVFSTIAAWNGRSPTPAVEEMRKAYNELILAVGRKYEGETRHQTALRYIQQAEQGSNEARHGCAAALRAAGEEGKS